MRWSEPESGLDESLVDFDCEPSGSAKVETESWPTSNIEPAERVTPPREVISEKERDREEQGAFGALV